MMSEPNSLSSLFLKEVANQLFLTQNTMLEQIQQKVLKEHHNKTHYYLSYYHNNELM